MYIRKGAFVQPAINTVKEEEANNDEDADSEVQVMETDNNNNNNKQTTNRKADKQLVKKKPFFYLLKTLNTRSITDSQHSQNSDGSEGEFLPFFKTSAAADVRLPFGVNNNAINGGVEGESEVGNKLLEAFGWASQGGARLGEMEAPKRFKSTLHPHQKQVNYILCYIIGDFN